MPEMLESAKSTVSSTLAGLTLLNVLSEEEQSTMTKVNGALEIFTGAAQMIEAATALQEIKNTAGAAIAAAETTALTITGVGLAKIAVAAAASAAVGVGMYAVLDTVLEGNLNDATDRNRINAEVGMT